MKINVDALKELMIEKKLTIAALAEITGLSAVTVASLLNSNKPRRFKTVGKLISGLNVKPEKIICD